MSNWNLQEGRRAGRAAVGRHGFARRTCASGDPWAVLHPASYGMLRSTKDHPASCGGIGSVEDGGLSRLDLSRTVTPAAGSALVSYRNRVKS